MLFSILLSFFCFCKVISNTMLCLVAQWCLDFSTPWTSAHHGDSMGILQARILEWVAMPPSRDQSVQYSRSVVSDSLQPYESQHTRPPCPSTPGVYPNSCPSSRWCHPPLLSPSPPAPNPSSESTLCMRWQKYWSFSFSISPSNEHPGLISFRMDWLDLLAV